MQELSITGEMEASPGPSLQISIVPGLRLRLASLSHLPAVETERQLLWESVPATLFCLDGGHLDPSPHAAGTQPVPAQGRAQGREYKLWVGFR